jgi:hypothetical protein
MKKKWIAYAVSFAQERLADDFAQELASSGYVTETPLDFKTRPPLPPGYENYWRKYQHFYMDAINALSYVCFTKLAPTQKLYDVWVKFNPKALAG